MEIPLFALDLSAKSKVPNCKKYNTKILPPKSGSKYR